MNVATNWLVFIFFIAVIACGTETVQDSEDVKSFATRTPIPIESTDTPTHTDEPTFTPTEVALVSTIEALLEDEEKSTPVQTSTPKPTKTATVNPTATPRTQQILPSIVMTKAAEPSFP